MMRGTLGPDLWNAKADGSLADFRRVVEAAGGTIAVDIETGAAKPDEPWTGKDPTRATLKTIAFGHADGGVSCHWDTCPADVRRYVAEILADPAHTKVFHNGPWFDLRVLRRYGLAVRGWQDSRDLRRALSSTSRLSLRYLGSLYCDISNWKDEEDEGAKGLAFTDNLTQLQEYNAKDTIVTARVWNGLRRDAGDDERVAALYEQHKELSRICAEMHSRGIYVRRDNREFLHHCLLQGIEERQSELRALVGDAEFPCTDHGMRALIYKRHAKDGIKCFNLPDPYDKKMWTNEHMETISVDESSLLMLMVSGQCPPELNPIIEKWWELQKDRKRFGYVKSELFDQAIGRDNRLRAGWNSCGTDTGRFSCSEPNIMNIEQVMRSILAPAPGMALVHADKKQLELRVMGCVAADMQLWDAINSGDVYKAEAREYYSIPADAPVKKDARQSAKIIRLARQYNAGLATVFAQALSMDRTFTISKAKLLMDRFDRRNYRTVQYWKEEAARVMECGYSESRIMGRRRTYFRPPDPSEIANYPVQSTAADIMNHEIIELDRQLKARAPRAHLVAQLHDAVDVECPESDVELVSGIVNEVMDREWTINGLTRYLGIDQKVTYSSQNGDWSDV